MPPIRPQLGHLDYHVHLLSCIHAVVAYRSVGRRRKRYMLAKLRYGIQRVPLNFDLSTSQLSFRHCRHLSGTARDADNDDTLKVLPIVVRSSSPICPIRAPFQPVISRHLSYFPHTPCCTIDV